MSDRKTTVLSGGYLLPEGPRWHNGALWFVDMLRGHVNRLEGQQSEVVATFDRPTALGFAPSGEMFVVDGNKSEIHTVSDGAIQSTLSLAHMSHHLNDMIVGRDGSMYVDIYGSDPFEGGWKEDGGVVLVKPGSEPQLVAENILGPNGIAISPDGKTLAVGESMGPGGRPSGARIRSYAIHDDGSLVEQGILGTVERGSGDGLCYDSEGGIWVGVAFGHEVQRFLGGEVVDRIVLEDRKWALACALGGPEMRTLYICSTAPPPKGDVTAYTDAWIETIEVDVPGIPA